MVSAMATQKDMQKDYVVRVTGRKVDIVYKTSDETLCRNFLAHVVKTSILEDLVISIKGPRHEDYAIGDVTFNVDTVDTINPASAGGSVLWTDTSATTGSVFRMNTSDI